MSRRSSVPRLCGSSDAFPAPIASLHIKASAVVSTHYRRLADGSRPSTSWLATHDAQTARTTRVRPLPALLRSATIDAAGRVATLTLDASGSVGTVSLWRNDSAEPDASRTEPRQPHSVAWFEDGKLLVGLHDEPWSKNAGPKLELWNAELTTENSLQVDDAGFDIASARGVVASTGIDLHIWRPGSPKKAFSLHEQDWGPPGEMGPCALSADARRVAVAHTRWHATEDQVWVLDVENPRSYKAIRDPSTANAVDVALSSDGQLLAVRPQETDQLRVYDLETLDIIADWRVPGAAAVGFHGNRRLVVGSSRLTLWEV